MGTRYPLARTSRRITYKLQTHDVRKYLLTDIVQRVRRAVTRSGGELRGGVYAPPKQITRWCVNRSPHVNKKSREKFWMITHKRVIKWDADSKVDMDAPLVISRMLPASVAIRTVEDVPGLMALKDVFQTMQNMKESVSNGEETENSEK
ncbi:30S ribosomal protein S10 [Gracilariopsis chorda]|uniref:30S ribosomal protein S10 n=1 Tax=Gracilariopsis chorda TaxID=448386 RepID=A0A2V3J8Z9_9FLOR|nr:30S ribosomal protein S10 [Gracilariopsis chorda]|eukprot:PXF49470.1 30S ribosomal protein S10 [Gracilariopsis chorda]